MATRRVKTTAVVQGCLAAAMTFTGGATLAGLIGQRPAGLLALTVGAAQAGWTSYTIAAIQESTVDTAR